MMSEVDHLSVFLSQFAQNMPQVFLAINMFTLVAVHLFPLYLPGLKVKTSFRMHHFEGIFFN